MVCELLDNMEQMKAAAEGKKVVLCGCGYMGRLTLKFLLKQGMDVKCFVITDSSKTGEGLVDDIPVYFISHYVYREDDVIIISTMEKLHEELCRALSGCGAARIYGISDILGDFIKLNEKAGVHDSLMFQIHIVEHCNLNCRGCYHFSPLAEEEYLDIEEYTRDIKRLSDLFDGVMDSILLLGGEPLLHPRVSEFFTVTRKYFPKGRIQILSNGILLPKMPPEFWKAVKESDAEIWLTKYPISLDYDKIEEIASYYGEEIFYFNEEEPVRTLGHQPLDISGKRDYKANFRTCYRANGCILLDHGKMYTCLIPAEIKHFNRYFHLNLEVCDKDYINIYTVNSGKELLEKLIEPTPFCRYCNRDDIACFGRIPWSLSKRDIKEWTE